VSRRPFAVLATTLVVLSACGLGGPRTFEGRIGPGMMTATDESNTIARIEFDPLTEVEVPREGVAAIPDEPKKLAIGWDVGDCAGKSSMLVTGNIESIEIAVKSPKCLDEAVRRIQVHLVFTEPADPTNVTVNVGYGPVAVRPVARHTG
jgi:predicted small lipoprotein YifL